MPSSCARIPLLSTARRPKGPRSSDLLHNLLEAQAYRLAFWRAAADEINYRRFFDINELAALRMENPEVFENTHRLVRELLAAGHVDGLRIDHPDGLYAPRGIFRAPAGHGGRAVSAKRRMSPTAGIRGATPALYMVVEKILASHRDIPSGPGRSMAPRAIDFAATCGGLFVDAGAADHFTRIYQGFIRARLGP